MVHPSRSLPGGIAALGLAVVLGSTSFGAEPVKKALENAGEKLQKAEQQIERAGERVRDASERVLDREQRVTANKVATPEQQAQNTDFTIASALAICNAEEIEVARLAKEHAKNDKVKAFAETIIEEHQQALSRLEKFGAKPQLSQAGQVSQAGQDAQQAKTANGQTETRQPQLTAGNQHRLDFLSIKRQIAQKGVESARKCWSDKKTDEAEMGFVGSQMVVHQQAIDAAEVLQEYASPELRPVIEEQLSMLRDHLKHAEQLIDSLSQEKYASK